MAWGIKLGEYKDRVKLSIISSHTFVLDCFRLAECVVAKEDDLGVNDTQFSCVSHLGNILNEGDVVLG